MFEQFKDVRSISYGYDTYEGQIEDIEAWYGVE